MDSILRRPGSSEGDLARRLCHELKNELSNVSSNPAFWHTVEMLESEDPNKIRPFLDWLDADMFDDDLDLHDECPPERSRLMLRALKQPNWPLAIETLNSHLPESCSKLVAALKRAHREVTQPERSMRAIAAGGSARHPRMRKKKTRRARYRRRIKGRRADRGNKTVQSRKVTRRRRA